jgi:hypothetical protein
MNVRFAARLRAKQSVEHKSNKITTFFMFFFFLSCQANWRNASDNRPAVGSCRVRTASIPELHQT